MDTVASSQRSSALDHDLSEAADLGDLAGADERRREVLANHGGSLDPRTGRKRLARVLARLEHLVGEVAKLEQAVAARFDLGSELARHVLDLLGRHDELDPVADALDGNVRKAVPVAPLVLGVEALDQLGDRLLRDRAVRNLDERRLPALAVQASVEAPPHGHALRGAPGALAQAPLHVVEHGRDRRRRLRGEHDVRAAAVVVDEVGAEQPERREQARVRRDDDPPHVQQLERRRQQHRPRRPVGDEREVARVDTVANGDVRDLLGDVRRSDAEGEGDALVEAKRACRAPRRRPATSLHVEPHLAAGEAPRRRGCP